jgi:hypothetical protein
MFKDEDFKCLRDAKHVVELMRSDRRTVESVITTIDLIGWTSDRRLECMAFEFDTLSVPSIVLMSAKSKEPVPLIFQSPHSTSAEGEGEGFIQLKTGP